MKVDKIQQKLKVDKKDRVQRSLKHLRNTFQWYAFMFVFFLFDNKIPYIIFEFHLPLYKFSYFCILLSEL